MPYVQTYSAGLFSCTQFTEDKYFVTNDYDLQCW